MSNSGDIRSTTNVAIPKQFYIQPMLPTTATTHDATSVSKLRILKMIQRTTDSVICHRRTLKFSFSLEFTIINLRQAFLSPRCWMITHQGSHGCLVARLGIGLGRKDSIGTELVPALPSTEIGISTLFGCRVALVIFWYFVFVFRSRISFRVPMISLTFWNTLFVRCTLSNNMGCDTPTEGRSVFILARTIRYIERRLTWTQTALGRYRYIHDT
jgi:hypothetical protein